MANDKKKNLLEEIKKENERYQFPTKKKKKLLKSGNKK